MATTNLFVELLVIGVGAASWIGLLVLSAFGVEFADAKLLNTYPVLMSLLALVYLLGIISDRVADFVFDHVFSGSLRSQYFDRKRDYQDAKRLVFNTSDRLADMHEYGRTRLRICRGWALNSALTAICLNVFLQTRCSEQEWFFVATRWGTFAFVALSLVSWWAWRLLCKMEYLKMREHAEFLLQNAPSPNMRAAA